MGNAIACKERGNPVPNTPLFGDLLSDVLREYVEKLDVPAQLRGYENALQELPNYRGRGEHYFILVIDPYSKELEVWGYKKSELQMATEDYSTIEHSIKGSEKNAVLVSVEKTSDLKKAYPNYFLDTSVFLDLVEWATK
jgi:hypothetical protein